MNKGQPDGAIRVSCGYRSTSYYSNRSASIGSSLDARSAG
jgi:hypothetical protein